MPRKKQTEPGAVQAPPATPDESSGAETIAKLESEIAALKIQLAEANDRCNELENGPAETPEYYTLRKRTETCQFYDSLFHNGPGWVHHDSEAFTNDSGYSNGIRDRALASIERAFDTNRLGRAANGRIDFSQLPAFDRGSKLEVIVRIVPS